MRLRTKGREGGTHLEAPASRAIDPRIAGLLEFCQTGEGLTKAATEQATRYASEGESLDRYLHDLETCLSAAGLGPATGSLLRAVTVAWADSYSERYRDVSCVHGASGLASVHHLQSEVHRLVAVGRAPIARTHLSRSTSYALLIVELPAEHATAESMSIVNTALRANVSSACVLASLSPRRSVALVRRSPDLNMCARKIESSLAESFGISVMGIQSRVWIEGLPRDAEAASQLVDELCR